MQRLLLVVFSAQDQTRGAPRTLCVRTALRAVLALSSSTPPKVVPTYICKLANPLCGFFFRGPGKLVKNKQGEGN